MAYSTVDDVRALIDTDVTDAEITRIIVRSDALINLLVPSSTNALILEELSVNRTTYRCMLKDAEAFKLGDYDEDRKETLKLLREEFYGIVNAANGGISFTATVESLA